MMEMEEFILKNKHSSKGVMVEWKLRDGERGGYITVPVSQCQAVFTLPGQDYEQRLI